MRCAFHCNARQACLRHCGYFSQLLCCLIDRDGELSHHDRVRYDVNILVYPLVKTNFGRHESFGERRIISELCKHPEEIIVPQTSFRLHA